LFWVLRYTSIKTDRFTKNKADTRKAIKANIPDFDGEIKGEKRINNATN